MGKRFTESQDPVQSVEFAIEQQLRHFSGTRTIFAIIKGAIQFLIMISLNRRYPLMQSQEHTAMGW